MKNLFLVLCLFIYFPISASIESEAQSALHYFLDEVELDATLTHVEQEAKVREFKIFSEQLPPEVSARLTQLLLEEIRTRIIDVAGCEKPVCGVENITVEIAREMLFFVAELKIHRRYVYDFGRALGCPEEQLLRHDLCKLEPEQFEGYARYFRGGRQAEDKLRYLAAWEHHQCEEHHHQCYSKPGFSFDNISKERLQNNMLETVADLLAATKQRGGSTLIHYLTHVFPEQNPHPRLLPFLEEALRKAHAFYLDAEENPDSQFKLFQGLPCWNHDVEEVFHYLFFFLPNRVTPAPITVRTIPPMRSTFTVVSY